MTIPVTTRSGKGSALTQSEMDTNLTNLGRDATEAQQGNVQIASSAEATAGTNDTKAISPAKLKEIVDAATALGANDLSDPGYYTLPGGLILQWGTGVFVGAGANVVVTYPIPFPTAVFHLNGVNNFADAGWELDVTMDINQITTTQFRFSNGGNAYNRSCSWFAIGI